MSLPKNLILSSCEKFLEKESNGTDYNEDKLSKHKFCFKVSEDKANIIYDNESSIKCHIDEDVLSSAINNLKKGKKDYNQKENYYYINIKKSYFDILLALDLSLNFNLKVILVIEEFDLENNFKSDKTVPLNINLFSQITSLLKDFHNYYLQKKVKEHDYSDKGDKITASNFAKNNYSNLKDPQNILLIRTEASYNLYKKPAFIKNYYVLLNEERTKPDSEAIQKAIKSFDLKSSLLQNPNMKGVKDLKPTKVELDKIPTCYYNYEDVSPEYQFYLKPTSLNNPKPVLIKEMFLKHKRRRTSITKPDKKAPEIVQKLYNDYQDVFANVHIGTIEKYENMLKYKETISS